MSEVPSTWAVERLESLTIADAPIIYGILQPGPDTPGGIPYVRPTEIVRDQINLSALRRTTQEIAQQYLRATLKADDVLLSIVGTIGKVAVVPSTLTGGNITQSSCRIRADKQLLDPTFLAQQLRSSRLKQQFDDVLLGTGVPRLNIAHVRDFLVVVPPLHEQRRIVAKLDALQSRTRLAREALATIPTLLDRYRQSILAAAFRGELTAEWRESKAARTPVGTALRSIETPPRPSRYGSRSDTVMIGDYVLAVGNPETELPSGWQWLPLIDIARLESGHTPSRQHPEWWGGDIPWICIPDARDHYGRVIMQTTENTNKLGLENSAARLLPAGTVCLSRTASVGYVTVMGKPMATSQDFVNWVCTPIIDPHWLLLMAENQALLRFGKGSTHTTIYFPEVVSFHVGLPPIEEQRLIVEIVERQMRRIDELATIVSAGLAACTSLDQSILAAAFRGELVPQDPTDEPASILLDRIRAARAQAGDPPRQRRTRASATPPPARAAEPATPYRATPGDPYGKLVAALRAKGSLASSDAQAATDLDAAGVRPLLQRLVTEKVAKVEGQKRGTRYVAT